jgi:uncharacterized damage-inducible protein DinB
MTTNNPVDILKKHLVELLTKGSAHVTFGDAVANIDFEKVGVKSTNMQFSIWQLVEHIRITQWDILDFSRNPQYKHIDWPKDYWPSEHAPIDKAAFGNSVSQIRKDLEEFIAVINNPSADLYTPFAHGDGQNLLREAMLIADHTSYHTGQIVVLRRLLDDWQ